MKINNPVERSVITSIYARRGYGDPSVQLISIAEPVPLADARPDELLAIRVTGTDGDRCLITTHRIACSFGETRWQLFFSEIKKAKPRDSGGRLLVEEDTLVIHTFSGFQRELPLPTSRALAGIWSILSFLSRRNKEK
jgi:hypothetical protein